MTRFAGAKRRAGFDGIMSHVDYGPIRLPPGFKYGKRVLVDVPVPALRPRRAVEGLLEIDQEKNSAIHIHL